MEYNLQFHWFVGIKMDEPVWNHPRSARTGSDLLNQAVAQTFFRGCWRKPSLIYRIALHRARNPESRLGRTIGAFRSRTAAGKAMARSFVAIGGGTTGMNPRLFRKPNFIAQEAKPGYLGAC